MRRRTCGRRWKPWLCGVALGVAVSGCDDDDVIGRVVVVGALEKELVGVWSGFAQISGSPTALSGLAEPTSTEFTFPVALELGFGGDFVLRTVSFSTNTGQADGNRTCVGLFTLHGGFIEFFPNVACRALPVHRFRLGPAFGPSLVLESVSGLGFGQPQPFPLRVVMRLDRTAFLPDKFGFN